MPSSVKRPSKKEQSIRLSRQDEIETQLYNSGFKRKQNASAENLNSDANFRDIYSSLDRWFDE